MSLWILIFLLSCLLLFLLPLLPGIVEIMHPTDSDPLRVSPLYDTNPFHFAEGFRTFLQRSIPEIHSAQNHMGRLENGTHYQLVGEKGEPTLNGSGISEKLILSSHTLTLPDGELFEQEVYSAQSILSGAHCYLRALLAEGELHLRDHCTVLRWAHSEAAMSVGRHTQLFGRATSRHSIILGDEVQFERLHAPQILTSRLHPKPEITPPPQTRLEALPDVKIQSGRRWLLHGHLDFPAAHLFEGDIVSGTTGVIGDYAHIKGSVKCNADNDIIYHLHRNRVVTEASSLRASCKVGNHVRIDGSLVSSHDLILGNYCEIFGPVIAEGTLIIGHGTVIGSPEYPTTVTAPRIIIGSDCVIHGTLWASEGGVVQLHGAVA